MTRWLNIIAMFAIAALLISSQCYAACFASLCEKTAAQDTAGCHQSSHQQNSGSQDCPHRHANLVSAGVTQDFAKAPAGYLQVPLWSVPVTLSGLCAPRLLNSGRTLDQRGSPPATPLFLSFSVLRI
jgi:hypothetical protein